MTAAPIDVKIKFQQDEYFIRVPAHTPVGSLVKYFLEYLSLEPPLHGVYGNEVALWIWAGHQLELNKTFEEQYFQSYNLLSISEILVSDEQLNAFYTSIRECKISDALKKQSFTRKTNQYSAFRDFIAQGPEEYCAALTALNVPALISDAFSDDLCAKISERYDAHGVFTRSLFHSMEFESDGCSESPVGCIDRLCQNTFEPGTYTISINMLFKDPEQNEYIVPVVPDAASQWTEAEINKIWEKCNHPHGYRVNITYNGFSVEHYFEVWLDGHGTQKAEMLNKLLELNGEAKRWITGGKGYILTTPETFQQLIENKLIPVDIAYYNPWIY